MKNLEKYIYIVIALIVGGVIISGIAYIAFNNKVNQENDGVKLVNTKKENNNIIQEYEITLNGKKNRMQLLYKLNKNGNSYSIETYYNNNQLYSFSKYNSEFSLNDAYDIDFIVNNFNENNFKIIKGEDNRNYLGIYSYLYNAETLGDSKLYLYNEDMEIISPGKDYNDPLNVLNNYDASDFSGFVVNRLGQYLGLDNVWYDGVCNSNESECQIRTKIENNKIYALVYPLVGGCTGGTLEERIYTIKDSKLDYKVINTYEVTEVSGSC